MFFTILRMVEKSSTTRIFMFLSRAMPPSEVFPVLLFLIERSFPDLYWPISLKSFCIFERSLRIALVWICDTRDSVNFSTWPISFMVSSS